MKRIELRDPVGLFCLAKELYAFFWSKIFRLQKVYETYEVYLLHHLVLRELFPDFLPKPISYFLCQYVHDPSPTTQVEQQSR